MFLGFGFLCRFSINLIILRNFEDLIVESKRLLKVFVVENIGYIYKIVFIVLIILVV